MGVSVFGEGIDQDIEAFIVFDFAEKQGYGSIRGNAQLLSGNITTGVFRNLTLLQRAVGNQVYLFP